MKNQTIGERIQALRKAKKLSQVNLAKGVGVSNVAISQWERSETEPKGDNLMALARALDCSPSFIIYGAIDPQSLDATVPYVPGKKYPLISWVSAGAWSEAVEPYDLHEIDEWYESDANTEGAAFWLRVKGDSMTSPVGLSIPEGMLVLVDTGREAKNGSLVIAKLTDANEATFKKLVIDEGIGQRYLQPLNPSHSRVAVNGNCRIIGVAIETKMRLV